MLYAPQTTVVAPQDMNVEASIFMVIWVALGGRGRLWGAIIGTLVVKYAQSAMTSDLPRYWPFVQGGMFIAVVLIFPDGLVGLWDTLEKQVKMREYRSAAFIGLSFVAIGLFIFCQALGLVPEFMNKIGIATSDGKKISLKYISLVGLLVISAWGTWAQKRKYQVRAFEGLPKQVSS
jgi:hypothetical protein